MTLRQDSGRSQLLAPAAWRIILITVLALLVGVMLGRSPVDAAPHASNYQLDVQLTNGSSFSYGGDPLPQFKATLTALNGAPLTTCFGTTYVNIVLDSDPGNPWGLVESSTNSRANTCLFTGTGTGSWNSYAPGSRTATFQAAVGGQVVATSTVTLTVNKTVTTTNCFVHTLGTVFQVGSMLQIAQQVQGPNTGYTPDWTKSMFDITLTGPASVTHTNLTPDTSPGTGWLDVPAPTTPGQYTMTCTFDGYGYYAPSTSGAVPIVISSFNQIGGIQLYTNPTTYNPFQSCDVYIVFQAAPGGPPPTGLTSIEIGQSSTGAMTIGSDGTLSVRLDPMPLPSMTNQITIFYNGDPYYRSTSSNFTFTNPPVPGSGNGGGSNGNGSGGKSATPGATATKTATGTPGAATPSATGARSANAGQSHSGSSGGSPLLWIVVLVLVLGLGGTGLAFFLRGRSAKPKVGVPFQGTHTTGWPPPLD